MFWAPVWFLFLVKAANGVARGLRLPAGWRYWGGELRVVAGLRTPHTNMLNKKSALLRPHKMCAGAVGLQVLIRGSCQPVPCRWLQEREFHGTEANKQNKPKQNHKTETSHGACEMAWPRGGLRRGSPGVVMWQTAVGWIHPCGDTRGWQKLVTLFFLLVPSFCTSFFSTQGQGKSCPLTAN